MGPPREPAKHLIATVDEPRTPAPQKLPRESCMSGYLPQLMTIILRSGGGYFQSFPGFPAETSNLSLRVPSAPWGGFNTCVMDRQLTYMRGIRTMDATGGCSYRAPNEHKFAIATTRTKGAATEPLWWPEDLSVDGPPHIPGGDAANRLKRKNNISLRRPRRFEHFSS